MRIRLAVLASLCSALSLVACTTQSPAADWQTGKDVLDGLKAAGFQCEWSGSGEQVLTEPVGEGETPRTAVRCDGYGVILIGSQDAFFDEARKAAGCRPLRSDEVGDMADTNLVLGSTFMVMASGKEFPGSAQPRDFVKAFGGEEITALDVYRRTCPDADVAEPASPSSEPSSSATKELDSALRDVALAMETKFTETDGTYPTSLEELDLQSPPGVKVSLKVAADGLSYCVAAESDQSSRYYNSLAGGLTDTPC